LEGKLEKKVQTYLLQRLMGALNTRAEGLKQDGDEPFDLEAKIEEISDGLPKIDRSKSNENGERLFGPDESVERPKPGYVKLYRGVTEYDENEPQRPVAYRGQGWTREKILEARRRLWLGKGVDWVAAARKHKMNSAGWLDPMLSLTTSKERALEFAGTDGRVIEVWMPSGKVYGIDSYQAMIGQGMNYDESEWFVFEEVQREWVRGVETVAEAKANLPAKKQMRVGGVVEYQFRMRFDDDKLVKKLNEIVDLIKNKKVPAGFLQERKIVEVLDEIQRALDGGSQYAVADIPRILRKLGLESDGQISQLITESRQGFGERNDRGIDHQGEARRFERQVQDRLSRAGYSLDLITGYLQQRHGGVKPIWQAIVYGPRRSWSNFDFNRDTRDGNDLNSVVISHFQSIEDEWTSAVRGLSGMVDQDVARIRKARGDRENVLARIREIERDYSDEGKDLVEMKFYLRELESYKEEVRRLPRQAGWSDWEYLSHLEEIRRGGGVEEAKRQLQSARDQLRAKYPNLSPEEIAQLERMTTVEEVVKFGDGLETGGVKARIATTNETLSIEEELARQKEQKRIDELRQQIYGLSPSARDKASSLTTVTELEALLTEIQTQKAEERTKLAQWQKENRVSPGVVGLLPGKTTGGQLETPRDREWLTTELSSAQGRLRLAMLALQTADILDFFPTVGVLDRAVKQVEEIGEEELLTLDTDDKINQKALALLETNGLEKAHRNVYGISQGEFEKQVGEVAGVIKQKVEIRRKELEAVLISQIRVLEARAQVRAKYQLTLEEDARLEETKTVEEVNRIVAVIEEEVKAGTRPRMGGGTAEEKIVSEEEKPKATEGQLTIGAELERQHQQESANKAKVLAKAKGDGINLGDTTGLTALQMWQKLRDENLRRVNERYAKAKAETERLANDSKERREAQKKLDKLIVGGREYSEEIEAEIEKLKRQYLIISQIRALDNTYTGEDRTIEQLETDLEQAKQKNQEAWEKLQRQIEDTKQGQGKPLALPGPGQSEAVEVNESLRSVAGLSAGIAGFPVGFSLSEFIGVGRTLPLGGALGGLTDEELLALTDDEAIRVRAERLIEDHGLEGVSVDEVSQKIKELRVVAEEKVALLLRVDELGKREMAEVRLETTEAVDTNGGVVDSGIDSRQKVGLAEIEERLVLARRLVEEQASIRRRNILLGLGGVLSALMALVLGFMTNILNMNVALKPVEVAQIIEEIEEVSPLEEYKSVFEIKDEAVIPTDAVAISESVDVQEERVEPEKVEPTKILPEPTVAKKPVLSQEQRDFVVKVESRYVAEKGMYQVAGKTGNYGYKFGSGGFVGSLEEEDVFRLQKISDIFNEKLAFGSRLFVKVPAGSVNFRAIDSMGAFKANSGVSSEISSARDLKAMKSTNQKNITTLLTKNTDFMIDGVFFDQKEGVVYFRTPGYVGLGNAPGFVGFGMGLSEAVTMLENAEINNNRSVTVMFGKYYENKSDTITKANRYLGNRPIQSGVVSVVDNIGLKDPTVPFKDGGVAGSSSLERAGGICAAATHTMATLLMAGGKYIVSESHTPHKENPYVMGTVDSNIVGSDLKKWDSTVYVTSDYVIDATITLRQEYGFKIGTKQLYYEEVGSDAIVLTMIDASVVDSKGKDVGKISQSVSVDDSNKVNN
jgi:hypothetical protein